MAKFSAAILISSVLVAPLARAADPWAPTATRAIPLKDAVLEGSLAPDTQLHLNVALKLRNAEQLKAFITAVNTPGSPWYGQFLTPDQFTSTYSALPSRAQAVAAYLRGAGFTDVAISANRQLIAATGTASQAELAFNTKLASYQLNGGSVFVNTLPAMVPSSLGDVVLAVAGLNNVPKTSPLIGPPEPTLVAKALGPADFQKVYNVGGTAAASGVTVAIIGEGSMTQVVKDVATYRKHYKLPTFPITVINTGAGPWTDTAGMIEYDMDTQTSTGLAGTVKELRIYAQSGLTSADNLPAYNQMVMDNIAKASSESSGICEVFPMLDGTMPALDQIFAEGAAQGQTFFVSSGDVGPSCPVGLAGAPIGVNGAPDSGIPVQQSYPASSPFAIAVGGTTVFRNSDGTYDFESAWVAGGGGPSDFESSQDWQSGIVPGVDVTGARSVPDIAMDADYPLSPAAFYSGGAATSNGGTSLSSPLALGAWARIVQAHGGNLGFAAPALYKLATAGTPSSVTGFNDVIVGNNGGYPATPGWDYTTGLGSFNIDAVSKLITPTPFTPSIALPAAGPQGNLCTLPGLTVNDDPSGDNLDAGVPGHDLRKVRIAEPYVAAPYVNAGDDKLVISMDIDDASSMPPQTIYFVFFDLSDGVTHYVAYWTTPAPAGTPVVPSNPVSGGGPIDVPFAYGHKYTDPAGAELWFDNEGATDSTSTIDVANNRIIWVLSKSKIPSLANNAVLKGVNGAVWLEDSLFGLGDTETLDSSVATDYRQVGNANCKSGVPPAGKAGTATDPAPLAGGALQLSLMLPLMLLGGLRRAVRSKVA